MNSIDSSVFIGYGNMGSAIVNSIYKKNIYKDILVIEPDKNKIEKKHLNIFLFLINLQKNYPIINMFGFA